MKPIEKYQQKFVELLKEMEEELGDCLKVEVCSYKRPLPSISSSYPPVPIGEEKVYDFSVATNYKPALFIG